MEFDLIDMNPPYEGSLHLSIINSVMKVTPNSDIVNLSPCRWLQDPMAEYKTGTDYKNFHLIWQNIKELDVVDHEKARKDFSMRITVDLGVYKIQKGGGFNLDTIRFKPDTKSFIHFVKNYPCKHFDSMLEIDKVDGIRVLVEGIQEQTTPWIFNPKKKTYVFFDGKMKDGQWWVNASEKRNQFSKNVGDPIPVSVPFKTEEEAYNFEAYCNSTFIKFCKWCSQTDIHPPFILYPFLDSYEHRWTDEEINEKFKITPEYFEYMKKCISHWNDKN